MTPEPTTAICLHCAADPSACEFSTASAPTRIRSLLKEPACPYDFCLWIGLSVSNGGLVQAARAAQAVMNPDDPRTLKWFKSTARQIADRLGLRRQRGKLGAASRMVVVRQ